jgi:hypothetical protein
MKKFAKFIVGLVAITAATVGAFGLTACQSGKTYTGEYHYNLKGTEYGVKVDVTVKNDKITKVKFDDCDYVEATATWVDIDDHNEHKDEMLTYYEGKTVQEIMAVTSQLQLVEPVGIDENPSVSDESLVLQGSTASSARLLRAVQDALSKIDK